MAYTSHLKAVTARHAQAVDVALWAAAQQIKQHVVRGYNPPEYFIGAAARTARYPRSIHPTGTLLTSITVSTPFDAGAGERGIRVGTNVRYALYWELGWQPRMTTHGPRRLYRKPVWVPALVNGAGDARAAFSRVYARAMGGGGIAPTLTITGPQDVAAD